jgi:hypothetical protein
VGAMGGRIDHLKEFYIYFVTSFEEAADIMVKFPQVQRLRKGIVIESTVADDCSAYYQFKTISDEIFRKTTKLLIKMSQPTRH